MLRRLLLLVALAALLVAGGRIALLVDAAGTPDAADASALPAVRLGDHRVGIVFGAGVKPDGQPTLLLRDRLRAGAWLLRTGRVDLLLLTGDNSRDGYDEPGAMRRALLADGVPTRRLAVDYGGRRTWDSCVRARRVFGVARAVTISNDFRRARTVALCRAAGIDVVGAVGTPTTRYPMHSRAGWELRELVASWRGVANAWVHAPKVPVGGTRIDPYDPCAVWRSLSARDRDATPSGC